METITSSFPFIFFILRRHDAYLQRLGLYDQERGTKNTRLATENRWKRLRTGLGNGFLSVSFLSVVFSLSSIQLWREGWGGGCIRRHPAKERRCELTNSKIPGRSAVSNTCSFETFLVGAYIVV